MSSKSKDIALSLFAIALFFILGGYFFWRNSVGTINVPSKAEESGAGSKAESISGLDLPDGFSIGIFAGDVPKARALAIDPKGRIAVSQTEEDKISILHDTDNDGVSDAQKVLKSGLSKPHGLIFSCLDQEECFLYVAQKDKLVRFPYDPESALLGDEELLAEIASSTTDRHFTRSIIFLPPPQQETLLVSVGSSCDACEEENREYGSIFSFNTRTREKASYAAGLRNATFMALNPRSGQVFATEMGRDALGDDIPPDEINIIAKGKNYGWPICFGKNIRDHKFDSQPEQSGPDKSKEPCAGFEPSLVDIPAHSAPLGLAFIPADSGWPEEYWHDLLVAYHGSWNRSVPTGYKIVRMKFAESGEYEGTEDFITGWLTEEGEKSGRPVDIKVFPGGTAYITDDGAGMIYKLERLQP